MSTPSVESVGSFESEPKLSPDRLLEVYLSRLDRIQDLMEKALQKCLETTNALGELEKNTLTRQYARKDIEENATLFRGFYKYENHNTGDYKRCNNLQGLQKCAAQSIQQRIWGVIKIQRKLDFWEMRVADLKSKEQDCFVRIAELKTELAAREADKQD